jgi:hypothetical protein
MIGESMIIPQNHSGETVKQDSNGNRSRSFSLGELNFFSSGMHTKALCQRIFSYTFPINKKGQSAMLESKG